ncbi:cytochrome c [Nannocystis exedens]|uniref:cytochrome c n=1 Tax=Nannocystis exedens TaxID=54 RepID=UPI000BBA0772|nr:cytochrome c [Nannocystis exedens]
MSRARSFVFTLVALTACNDSSNTPTTGADASTSAATDPGTAATDASTDGPATTSTTTGDDPTTTSPTSTTGDPVGPTYYRDIKAILDAKCATCHRPGDIAPFSLTNYDEAGMFAKILAPAIENRTMPPWPPGADCNQFAHDRGLTDAERELVLAWIAADAPAGDPDDAPRRRTTTRRRSPTTCSSGSPSRSRRPRGSPTTTAVSCSTGPKTRRPTRRPSRSSPGRGRSCIT